MDLTPYSSVKPLLGPLPQWLTAEDAERLQAYAVYEGIYRNVPEVFKLVQRGSEQNPIYLPSARTIIEAKNRYLAKRWNYTIVPGLGTDADRKALDFALETLFRREIIRTKFGTQKRWGLVRGDSVWHIVADEEKPPTRRISVYEVDPASYFPIYDPWNPDKILGVHLVDPVENAGGKTVIKRQTYRKVDEGISYELSWWESGAWDDRDESVKLKKADAKDIPEGDDNAPDEYLLPAEITSIPVYHIKNNRVTGQPFGTSDLAGFETLFAGINQAISDEDLTLALQGLGLYWTNSGPPVDPETDEETNWKFGPGWVLEIDEDSTFGRVSGVSSVTPMLEHIGKLEGSMREASGVPSIAIGNVDTQVAESGIALAFHMAPILASNEEKEDEILGRMDHMIFDLVTMWFPTFEGFTSPARAISKVDDPLPTNRKAVLEEVIMMLSADPPLISAEYARTILQEKLGFNFPDEMANAVVTEAQAIAEARSIDPFATRARFEQEQQENAGAS